LWSQTAAALCLVGVRLQSSLTTLRRFVIYSIASPCLEADLVGRRESSRLAQVEWLSALDTTTAPWWIADGTRGRSCQWPRVPPTISELVLR